MEVMVCVLIASILASLVVASLSAARTKNSLPAALAILESQDRLARDRAARFRQPVLLHFDIQTGQVLRVESPPSGKARRTVILPGGQGAGVERCIILGESSSARERFDVECHALGRSASYAALVSANGQRQWVVVCGLTGEFSKVEDESEVHHIFGRSASGRHPD